MSIPCKKLIKAENYVERSNENLQLRAYSSWISIDLDDGLMTLIIIIHSWTLDYGHRSLYLYIVPEYEKYSLMFFIITYLNKILYLSIEAGNSLSVTLGPVPAWRVIRVCKWAIMKGRENVSEKRDGISLFSPL